MYSTSTCLIIGLLVGSGATAGEAVTVTKPGHMVFSQTPTEVKRQLSGRCERLSEQSIDPVQIPGAQSQSQLDCHGHQYAGKPRLAEYVFRNQQLYLSWILVEATELDELESRMRDEYGQPDHSTQVFSAWTSHRTALRKDIPEVLFYAPAASEQFNAWFQAAGE